MAANGSIKHFVVGSKHGTRVVASSYHIQNVNSLHAHYGKFIKRFCGPATKFIDGHIQWLEARLSDIDSAELMCSD